MPPRLCARDWPISFLPAALLASWLNGCAQVDQAKTALGLGSNSLAIDPADPCHTQRAAFADSQSYFTDEILTSSLIGAVTGTALGAGTASATGGKASVGALIGGLTGLGVGASAGYYKVMAEKHADQQDLAQSINKDLRVEGEQIDHTTAAFARLRQCRFTEAARIKKLAHTGQIERSTATAQLNRQRELFDQEIALAQRYGVNMAKRDDQFRDAADELRKKKPRAPPSDPTSQVELAATGTIPEKRSTFDKSVAAADSNGKLAFNLESNTDAHTAGS